MNDMSTPATILRYTNSWNGSAQGWLPAFNPMAKNPMKNKLKGLNNFYFCSHWNIPGGGLPIALITARDTARELCKKHNVKFVTLRNP
jgi:phytoene dehydrogenase-like protein